MANQINVACSTVLKIDTGASNALEILGYSVDGFSIEERVYREDIHSDEAGGTSGPPVDIIIHGQIDVITFDAVSIDPAVAAKVQYVRGTAVGSTASPCTLMFGDAKYYRVLLLGTTFTRNYVKCVLTQKSLGRVGAHATMFRYTIECYTNASSVLWNTTTA